MLYKTLKNVLKHNPKKESENVNLGEEGMILFCITTA
jgi:hypothetical protein